MLKQLLTFYILIINALSEDPLDFISEKTKECYGLRNLSKRIQLFTLIDHPHIKPVKITPSSSVFLDTQSNYIIKRVEREKTSLRQEEVYCTLLEHPNIVKTYKVLTKSNPRKATDIFYIIQEYLNTPLSTKLIKNDEGKIRKLCIDILNALDYLHRNDIAHLDIKIGNIMGHKDLTGNITYKLIDFGFARQIIDDEIIDLKNKYYGTYPYSPPEIYLDCIYSKKSDVFCLGVVVYFLVADYRIFYKNGERDYDVYEDFLKGKLPMGISYVSDELKKFITRCLTFDYNMRPSVEELLEDDFIVGVNKEN